MSIPDAVPVPVDLKALREAKGMALAEVAHSLKVSPRIIEAVEAAHWSDLPGRAFCAGLLRAYGRLLGVAGPVLDGLIATLPGSAVSVMNPVLSNNRAAPCKAQDGSVKRQNRRALRWSIVMVIVAALQAYVVPSGFWAAVWDETQEVASTAYDYVADEIQARFASEPEPLPANAVTSADPQAQASNIFNPTHENTGVGTLALNFAAPSWVEVRDYQGRIIYSQLNAANTSQFITGVAPLEVVVGNAKQVSGHWREAPLEWQSLSDDDVARQVLR